MRLACKQRRVVERKFALDKSVEIARLMTYVDYVCDDFSISHKRE